MKSKNIKVAYTTRFQKKGLLTVPKIQIKVEYEDGSIRIRPLTKDEQISHNQQLLQAEIKRKAAELNLLGKEYEQLYKVAEPSGIYGASTDSKS